MSPYKLCSVVRLSDAAVRGEEEMAGPSRETPLILAIRSTDDFPGGGGVWNDTPHSTWDQVMKIYVKIVHPDFSLTFLHFVMIRNRLHQVNHDTQKREKKSPGVPAAPVAQSYSPSSKDL